MMLRPTRTAGDPAQVRRLAGPFTRQGTARRGSLQPTCWLVFERDNEPAVCIEDPGLPVDRYVYVEADAAALFPIARGLRGWRDAIADGSVQVFGEPELVRELPGWFRAVEQVDRPAVGPSLALAGLTVGTGPRDTHRLFVISSRRSR